MKKLPVLILVLSLAANAALIFVVMKRPTAPAKPVIQNPHGIPVPTPLSASSAEPLNEEELRGLVVAGDIINSNDLPTLIARLRAAGFPADVVRAIVTAHVTRDFGERRKAVVGKQEVIPFWRVSLDTFPYDPKAGAELGRLARDQRKILKQLLGTDAQPDDSWSQLLRDRRYGYLPEQKSSELQDVMADYNELRSQIYADARGVMLPEDQAKIALLEKEQRADIASLFTAEELENYDLRTSNTARSLRYQLAGFEPTEAEFRAIYKIQHEFQERFPPSSYGQLDPGVLKQMQAAQQQLPEQIKAVLTPERAATYTRTTEPAYQQATQVLARLELPSSFAADIVSVQKDIIQRTQTVQNDRALNVEDRNAQLAALLTEAKSKLTGTLGERGYEVYKSQAGYWLNNLNQQPASRRGARGVNFGTRP